MGLIKVAEISIDKLEDRKTVTAILHENGYTVGPGKRKKTETGKQLDYYLKVYVEEGTDKAELYKATSGKTKVTAKKVTDKMSAEIVCDSLNLVAYHDDSAVVDAQVRKFYSETPRVDVMIKVVGPDQI